MVWRDLYNFQSRVPSRPYILDGKVLDERHGLTDKIMSNVMRHHALSVASLSRARCNLLLPHSGVARIPSASGAAGCSTLLLALVGDVALFNTKGNEALSAQAGSLFHWNSMGQL